MIGPVTPLFIVIGPDPITYQQESRHRATANWGSSSEPLLAIDYGCSEERGELKGQIARFLKDHLGKSRLKAASIVSHLPASTTIDQLRNIYDVLNIIKKDTGALREFRKNISWKQGVARHLFSGDNRSDTTREQRLKSRALALFALSGIDPGLKDINVASYRHLQQETMYITSCIRWAESDPVEKKLSILESSSVDGYYKYIYSFHKAALSVISEKIKYII